MKNLLKTLLFAIFKAEKPIDETDGGKNEMDSFLPEMSGYRG